MDLQISVFLLFGLFTSGHPLSCYECMSLDSCADQNVITCPSGLSKCISATQVTQVGETTFNVSVKNCTVDCPSGSLNFRTYKTSYSCCDTDLCNIQDAPDPSTNNPNGKKCYYCDGQNCSNTVSCAGSEDRCITVTFENQDSSANDSKLILKGCVSKSICDYATESFNSINGISCCEGNLCNDVNSVTQNVTQNVTQSITQSTNSAKSVTQSFLLLTIVYFIK